MLRRCPKCRKDGGLVYCPVCHGVKRDTTFDELAKVMKTRDDLRAMLIARGETDESIAAELALIAAGRVKG